MRLKHLLGLVTVLLLILAVWLVPMALADDSMDYAGPYQTGSQAEAPSGSECPYLQAHPWLDPHGSGAAGATGGAAQTPVYY